MILYYYLPGLQKLIGFHKRVLLYGAGELGRSLFRIIANSPKLGVAPMGFIDDGPSKLGKKIESGGFSNHLCISVLGTGSDVRRLTESYIVEKLC